MTVRPSGAERVAPAMAALHHPSTRAITVWADRHAGLAVDRLTRDHTTPPDVGTEYGVTLTIGAKRQPSLTAREAADLAIGILQAVPADQAPLTDQQACVLAGWLGDYDRRQVPPVADEIVARRAAMAEPF